MSHALKTPADKITPAGDPSSRCTCGRLELPPSSADLSHDERLRLSRRIDWRYLLSSPELGRVACVSPGQSLRTSLEAFSKSVTLIAPPPLDCPRHVDYDVVVLQDPAPPVLAEMAGLVRPGGHLYVEVVRPLAGRLRRLPHGSGAGRGGKLRTFADYAAELRRLDFAEIAFHGHWPNFEACTDFVPLDDDAVLRGVLAQRADSLGWWKSAVARLLVASGHFASFVPCFSLVAQRKADG